SHSAHKRHVGRHTAYTRLMGQTTASAGVVDTPAPWTGRGQSATPDRGRGLLTRSTASPSETRNGRVVLLMQTPSEPPPLPSTVRQHLTWLRLVTAQTRAHAQVIPTAPTLWTVSLKFCGPSREAISRHPTRRNPQRRVKGEKISATHPELDLYHSAAAA